MQASSPALPTDGDDDLAGTFDRSAYEAAVADSVYAGLAQARLARGAGALRRWPALDEAARARARAIAVEEPGRRLRPSRPLEDYLDASAQLDDRRVAELVELQPDGGDPAATVLDAWRSHPPSWELIVAERVEALGVAAALAGDGTLVVVALVLEREFVATDLKALERRVEAEINRIRAEQGLRPLSPREQLRRIARRHSEDMARRGYFNHVSPEGRGFKNRVQAERVPFRRVAENIGKSLDMDDPVSAVVDGWLHSPGHRENLMSRRFRRTGVGIAVDERGAFYFTQLFIEPSRAGAGPP